MSTAVADRSRPDIQAKAAQPRDPELFPRLLDDVIRHLGMAGRSPRSALAVAGQVTAGTNWQGYRAGRTRIATMAASYLRGIAPPHTWQFTGVLELGKRLAPCWLSPDGETVVDILEIVGDAHHLVRDAFDAAEAGEHIRVRLVRMQAPTTSLLYTSPNRHVPLPGTDLWFEDLADAPRAVMAP